MAEQNPTTDLPHAIWSGSFHLFGVEVKCHTLSDGQRIIEADSMHKLLEAMGDGQVVEHDDLTEFAKWQRG
jgi:hypothetical protein